MRSRLNLDEQHEGFSGLKSSSVILSGRTPGQRPGATQYKPIPRKFFDRDPRVVSPELLGKVLVRRQGRKLLVGRIVEVEAYGEDDPAAHSYAGRTKRNAVLFGPPGYVYVYFIYGNQYCLNVSCLPEGTGAGILFRAIEPLLGVKEMARARCVEIASPRDLPKLTSGPGRLAEAFGITRERDNEKDLTDMKSDLFIADDGFPAPKVLATKRIGIMKAVDHPFRFIVAGSPFVSGKKNFNSVNG